MPLKISSRLAKLRQRRQQLQELVSLEQEIDELENRETLIKSERSGVIIKIVCKELRVSISDIIGSSRREDFVTARHVAMALVFKFKRVPPHVSNSIICEIFKRDRSDVFYACRRVLERIETDRRFSELMARLESSISEKL